MNTSQEIRGLFNVCRDPFNSDIYSSLRSHLYGISDGIISGRQLQAICEVKKSVKIERKKGWDRWMYGWMDGWMNGWIDGWIDGWVDGWMDEWMDGWMDDG